ncbi:hypothetical protein IV102_37595 [bacterium]|nr:hypothetical protein [bacterium]
MASTENTVQISKTALAWLVGGLVLCMVALAFMLGRQSVSPVVAPVAAAPVAPVAAVAPVAPVPVEAEPVASVSVEPVEAAPPPVAAPVAVRNPAPPAKPKLPAGESVKVRKYLEQVDAITAGTQSLGNPSDFANDLLNQSLMGDTSGIDSLLAQVRQSQSALAQIQPPASCKEHYQLLGQQLQGSLNVLQQLKKALVTSDTSGLAALAGQGSAMQAQAQRLQRLTTELKERT